MENVFYGSFTEDTTQMEGHTEGIPHFGFQGPPAEVSDVEVVYQAGMSAVEMPTGSWSSAIPKVPAGQYLWTRTTIVFNLVTPVTF